MLIWGSGGRDPPPSTLQRRLRRHRWPPSARTSRPRPRTSRQPFAAAQSSCSRNGARETREETEGRELTQLERNENSHGFKKCNERSAVNSLLANG